MDLHLHQRRHAQGLKILLHTGGRERLRHIGRRTRIRQRHIDHNPGIRDHKGVDGHMQERGHHLLVDLHRRRIHTTRVDRQVDADLVCRHNGRSGGAFRPCRGLRGNHLDLHLHQRRHAQGLEVLLHMGGRERLQHIGRRTCIRQRHIDHNPGIRDHKSIHWHMQERGHHLLVDLHRRRIHTTRVHRQVDADLVCRHNGRSGSAFRWCCGVRGNHFHTHARYHNVRHTQGLKVLLHMGGRERLQHICRRTCICQRHIHHNPGIRDHKSVHWHMQERGHHLLVDLRCRRIEATRVDRQVDADFICGHKGRCTF